jgi:2-methylcitrate dehydratase PrpD
VSATDRLIDFASAAHDLPPLARAAADRLLADTLLVGAAGSWHSAQCGVDAVAASWGKGAEARPIGPGHRLPAPSAAFLNGFRIHCLEWDAVHEGAVVHALSVVTAALGAVIDRAGGCAPEAALAALAVGVDVASGLGLAASGGMRFFRPATAGIIGAALACARIVGAPPRSALGFAYSQAAGTMQAHVEGSIALPLQIAHAARAAVTAVDLARAGLESPREVLEGTFGYFRLFEDGDLVRYTDHIGEHWLIEQVSVKPYPSGRASHGVLGALQQRVGDGREIHAVEVHVPPLVARLVARPMKPHMTASYARLCLPFLAALMLREGRIDPRSFTPEAFADPGLTDRASRVRVHLDTSEDLNALAPQQVILTFADGGREELHIGQILGSPGAPLEPTQLRSRAALAHELAGDVPDPRLFENPLAYFTEPR